MSRVRVLIADDRPIFRAGVQGMLRDFPEIDIVGEAVTGRQAVEHTRRLKPDVVLMDLNMPEMGGIAATRAIKEEDPERVVLALTVSEAEEDIVEMEPLTERETEILQSVVEGKGNKAIANRLGLSEGTIKSHLRNIYRKLRVQTRAEAAAQAVQLDIDRTDVRYRQA